jgi:hypothetical protein
MNLDTVPQGAIKSFGAFGPKYEVREPLRPLADGGWMITSSFWTAAKP